MSTATPQVDKQIPIRLRMRPDLVCNLQHWQGVEYWVVKEPLGQKYYQFPPHVFFLLEQLNSQRSVHEILDNYHEKFSPKRLSQDQLHSLLQRFHRDGLVISDAAGQGTELLRRGRKNRSMERLQTFSNILAVRFRGVDPERLLNRMSRWTDWLFTKPAAIFLGILALVALLSVVVNWAEFSARLPGFDQFFDVRRWLMFGCVIAIAKVIHEFGHGLACKRFGGECHEIGFMLLVMTPCLYCNVSDSWRLPNKWHRATIGAAGMYFEIIIATIATFVWWFASSGFVQEVCLQFMLVASVSTVIFNGNPLLRFDGYYILSDVLEIPNLQQKSTQSLTTLMGRHWMGLEMPDDPMLPRNRMLSFAMFTVASTVYKWMVMIAILLFLTRWLQPYGLESVGKGLAWFAAIGMLVWPAWKLYKYFSVPGRIMQIKPRRFAIVSGIIVVVLGLLMLIPFPHYLRCDVVVLPRAMSTVYAQEPGRLVEMQTEVGARVKAGDLLARLHNEELELAVAKNWTELEQTRNRREQLMRAGTQDPASMLQLSLIPSLEAEIVRHEETDRMLKQRVQMLELRSDVDGIVVATPFNLQLPGQWETPLVDDHPVMGNVQHRPTLNRGDRLCEVADTAHWRGVILLDEQQIKFVAQNQKLWIRLLAYPGTMLVSKLDAVGPSDQISGREDRNETAETTRSRSRLPDLITELVPAANQNSMKYFALTELSPPDSMQLKIGLNGECRIQTGYRSLWFRIRWWFNQNFGG